MTVIADSILQDIKATLGLAIDYTPFDRELILYVNSVLATLNQLGVGPEEGLFIANETTTWTALIGTDPRLNPAKAYINLRVTLLFDNATLTGPVIQAIKEQIKELEWRLQVQADPVLPPFDGDDDEELGIILDGGAP